MIWVFDYAFMTVFDVNFNNVPLSVHFFKLPKTDIFGIGDKN